MLGVFISDNDDESSKFNKRNHFGARCLNFPGCTKLMPPTIGFKAWLAPDSQQ